MIKNNRGFMLIEVIITSTVVLTGMVLLFSTFNSLYSKYKSRENYHDIDTFYATKEMIDYLMENDFTDFINQNLYENESIFLIENGHCKDSSNTFCNKLQELYGIENMIFTTYDKQNLENLKTGKDTNGTSIGIKIQNETFRDYIDYVINYYNIQNENINVTNSERKNEYTYFFLTEAKNTDTDLYTYASIAIRQGIEMKLNQKGYMLVELVLSSVLAMTIALYLINLTYQFKNKNEDIYQSITYSKDKIVITKNIMNDLDNQIVTFIKTDSTKTGDKTIYNNYLTVISKKDSTENFRNIQIVQSKEGTSIFYGKWNKNTNSFDKSDVSYYEKKLDKSLIVRNVKIETNESDDFLSITIPIESMYTKERYDIKLLVSKLF